MSFPVRHKQSVLSVTAYMVLAALLRLAGPAPAWAEEAPVTVFAVGDMARCRHPWWAKAVDTLWGAYPESRAAQTAALIEHQEGAVLALGDLVYYEDTLDGYRECYDASWGRFRARTWPVPGNHDYRDGGAAYFAYWGTRAGEAGRGYYSFKLGTWHLVALNSNIDMGPESEQGRWLRDDLVSTRARCILAYWHHPLFTSGRHHVDKRAAPTYRMLYEAGASLVLNGHGHSYERFAPQDAEGRLDPEHGLRSFVVGTGGARLRDRVEHEVNSEAFDAKTWGVLQLELYEDRYAWRFLAAEGGTFADSGTSPCVSRGPGN